MANIDYRRGMHPQFGPFGSTPPTRKYPLRQAIQAATPYQTVIYKGMAIKRSTSGWAIAANATNVTNSIGVAAEYYAGSAVTKSEIMYWPGDSVDFQIQSDNTTSTGLTAANFLHKNFALISQAAGDTNSGISKAELDYSSGEAATGTNMLRCIDVIEPAGGSKFGANAYCIVRFNDGFLWSQESTIV